MPSQGMDVVVLTPADVAKMLKVSVAWVYEKSRSRQRDPLPVFRIGRYNRFTRAAVMAWLEQHGNTAAKRTLKKEVSE
jgi:excisionase family DNA binding protein